MSQAPQTTPPQTPAPAPAAAAAPSPSRVPSPAGDAPKKAEAAFVPMSLPQTRLAAPAIAGYHTHWMRGSPERIMQAQRAGYEFVAWNEVDLNNFDLGGDAKVSGNSDMGTRVSVLASISGDGNISKDGQPLRLVLMKQKEELYRQHQSILERRNDDVASALTASFQTGAPLQPAQGEGPQDLATRYIGSKQSRVPDLFRKKRKSP